MKGQNFSSQVLSRHTFRILRKKGSDFFDHRGTLRVYWIQYIVLVTYTCQITTVLLEFVGIMK